MNTKTIANQVKTKNTTVHQKINILQPIDNESTYVYEDSYLKDSRATPQNIMSTELYNYYSDTSTSFANSAL